MKFQIKKRFSFEILFEMEAESLKQAVEKAHLSDADLSGADLSDANLSDANLSGADLRSADLSDANLSGADLRSADLSDADLRGADLRSADLSGADLRSAHLSDADLSGADLRYADLSDANLSGADLSDANLSGVNLRSADLSDADLSGADLRYADLSGADLRSANLSGADLSDANLSGVNLRSADLSDADLRGADLSDADLRGVNLRSANLSGVNLRSADLRGAENDMLEKMGKMPTEVPYLYNALHDGKVDGSIYNGECACFCGTLAKAKQVSVNNIPIILNANSPIERFFLAIRKGDTPLNNPISKIAAEWIEEFCKANSIPLPVRKVIWGMTWIEAIEARLKAATPGPWAPNIYFHSGHGEPRYAYPTGPRGQATWDRYRGHTCDYQTVKNSEFIAAAPTDTAHLLEALRVAMEALKFYSDKDVTAWDHNDDGAKARTALEKIEKLGEEK